MSVRSLFFSLLAFLLLLGPWASADIVSRSVHNYSYGGDEDAITIGVTVHDNLNGDPSRFQWIYVVQNNSYDPFLLWYTRTGFASFYLDLNDVLLMYEIEDVTAPGANWGEYLWRDWPYCWDITSGQGLRPGDSGVFSFSTLPRETVLNAGGFCSHTMGTPGFDAVFFSEGNGLEGPGARIQDPTPGMCCLPDGTCNSSTQHACEEAGGTFLGADGECSECEGHCQAADGTCLESNHGDCLAMGGRFCGKAAAVYFQGVSGDLADGLYEDARGHLLENGWRIIHLDKTTTKAQFVAAVNQDCVRGVYLDTHGYEGKPNSIEFAGQCYRLKDVRRFITNPNLEFVSTTTCGSDLPTWQGEFSGSRVYVAANDYKNRTTHIPTERVRVFFLGSGVDDEACNPLRKSVSQDAGEWPLADAAVAGGSGCVTFALCDSVTGLCGEDLFPSVACRDSIVYPGLDHVDLPADNGAFNLRLHHQTALTDSLWGVATLMTRIPEGLVMQTAPPLNRYLSYGTMAWPQGVDLDSLVVSMTYSDEDLAAAGVVQEADIGVAWFTRGTEGFQILPCRIDSVANTVSFQAGPSGVAGLYNLGAVSGVSQDMDLRGSLEVWPCYPNPFNPKTNIAFATAEAGGVKVMIHDLAGRRIRLVHSGELSAGEHVIPWSGLDDQGRRVGAGVYLVSVRTAGSFLTQRVVLLK